MKSPLRYPGGKGRAAKQLVSLIRQYPFRTYVEPFLGGGSVFLELREQWGGPAILADKYQALTRFWQVIGMDEPRWMMVSLCRDLMRYYVTVDQRRELFNTLRQEDGITWLRELTDLPYPVHEAVRFFLLNRMSFSGTTEAGGFSRDAALKRLTLSSVDRIEAAGVALGNTTIICDSAIHVIADLGAGDQHFIYCDPPYVTADKLYGAKGSLHDFPHDKLAWLLRYHYKGRFLVSYDDCPEVRELYGWADIGELRLQYGMDNPGGVGCKLGQELVIQRRV